MTSSDPSDLVRTLSAALASPPRSRYLQVRVEWTSIADWAPVLTNVWVESHSVHVSARTRRWELTIDAGDRKVRRDGSLSPRSGRDDIDALWDAWELGTPLPFEDIDNDANPVTYTVAIAEIEERAPKPADAARWGESAVSLTLEEV